MCRLVVVGVAMLLLAGCVKEDRGGCPCYLTLNLDRVIEGGEYGEAVATLNPCMDGNPERKYLDLQEYEESGYEKQVKRELVSVSVVCGQENAVFLNDCLAYPEGVQSDPIMAYAESILCKSEENSADVILHKQYCRLTFLREGEASEAENRFSMRVSAECCGMMLYDLSPLDGPFVAIAGGGDTGDPYVLLPRQIRSELTLDIIDVDGQVLSSVDLGEEFEKIAYDWKKEDLDDVNLKIDYAKASLEIGIIPWKTNYETIDI